MSGNILVQIPIEDWPKLRDLYKDRKLEPSGFNLLQNFISWLQQDSSLKNAVKLYSLNSDWSDGTFILQDHKDYIYMNTLEDTQDRLLTALKCLDGNAQLVLSGFPLRIKKTVDNYLTSLGINKDSSFLSTTIWHHIDMKKALEFNTDPPDGLTLAPLRMENVDLINNSWPHRHPNSELFVGRLVRYGQNVGAFDEEENLVAWCLTLPLGSLGLLQVLETHKRKGLGSLMVRAMAKQYAEKGMETMAPVVESNVASLAMFKNIGFSQIDKALWINKPEMEVKQ